MVYFCEWGLPTCKHKWSPSQMPTLMRIDILTLKLCLKRNWNPIFECNEKPSRKQHSPPVMTWHPSQPSSLFALIYIILLLTYRNWSLDLLSSIYNVNHCLKFFFPFFLLFFSVFSFFVNIPTFWPLYGKMCLFRASVWMQRK